MAEDIEDPNNSGDCFNDPPIPQNNDLDPVADAPDTTDPAGGMSGDPNSIPAEPTEQPPKADFAIFGELAVPNSSNLNTNIKTIGIGGPDLIPILNNADYKHFIVSGSLVISGTTANSGNSGSFYTTVKFFQGINAFSPILSSDDKLYKISSGSTGYVKNYTFSFCVTNHGYFSINLNDFDNINQSKTFIKSYDIKWLGLLAPEP